MVINIMFMNRTYAVFMLRASLSEGTRGVTNVGGHTACTLLLMFNVNVNVINVKITYY